MADTPKTNAEFAPFAMSVLGDVLEHHPDWATALGVHDYDGELPDSSPSALEAWHADLDRHLEDLSEFRGDVLDEENGVDSLILKTTLEQLAFELDELREHTWNPMVANPGRALYDLIARDFAPAGDRLHSLAGRLAAVPASLATAQASLGAMPKVHLETALGQFAGTIALVGTEVDRLLDQSPSSRSEIDVVRPAALEALEDHRRWLEARLDAAERDNSFRDPRIGAEYFGRKLVLTLDTDRDAGSILARAEADFERLAEEITEVASRRLGRPPSSPGLVIDALNALAEDAPDNDSILDLARAVLGEQIAFVQDNAVVTTYDDPYQLIPMPEIDRGVAVAYCDSPGPLETAQIPTLLAVSPTPSDWTPERTASFFREYNRHMVHDLMAHEAMPGHMLQLQHSRRFVGSSAVRAAFYSGSFVEGWAVYSEQLLVELGYPGAADPEGLRLQQLKMQLRTTLNAILDAKVHTEGLTEEEAMKLMMERAFQEDGEAAGKWRRALLTSAQLSTYYVGFSEVSDLAGDLRTRHPDWTMRTLHDQFLRHGSPPARHLRTLVDRAPA